jgi:AraC family transcriptional regulator
MRLRKMLNPAVARLMGRCNYLYRTVDRVVTLLTFCFVPGATETHHALPDRALRRTLDKMETECSSDITLESLALESGYSTNHFLQMFRASTGSTPYQYLLNLRIKRAQSMMNHKSMQLLDIALECGFSSHAQFSRMFRKILGMTPSQYRRSLR